MSLLFATLLMFSERYKLNPHMNCRLIFSFKVIIIYYTYYFIFIFYIYDDIIF